VQTFYELLVPKIVAYDFGYKSSKNMFVKRANNIEYKINFHWDGRGGTTMCDTIGMTITELEIEKSLKLRTKSGTMGHVFTSYGYCAYQFAKIPTMYSRATLVPANNMNFKALAQLPLEEKYPIANIQNSAQFVENLIITEILPFFQKFNNVFDFYDHWMKKMEAEPDMTNVSVTYKELLKQYCIRLDRPVPAILGEW
jgi:hypothetical protein